MQSIHTSNAKRSIDYAPQSSPRDDVGVIVQQVQEAARLPLNEATTLPRASYLSQEFFELEEENVFRAGWMCIGHVSQVRNPGDYLAIELLGEPLLVVRDQDQQVRVLSRICPHRATDIMHPAFEKPCQGNVSRLVCPYHAWGFKLNGELFAAPEMDKSTGFQLADWRLEQYRSCVWEGFIFVNLDGNASPLEDQYGQFRDAIQPWNMADLEVAFEMEWECDFNWKVMIENWMEPYHHIGIHSESIQPTMPARMTHTEPAHPHFFQCHLYFRKSVADEVRRAAVENKALDGFTPISGLTVEQQVEWGLFLGYPCLMVLTARDRVFWYRLQPVSAGKCKLTTYNLVSKEAMAAPDYAERLEEAKKLLVEFHTEDMQVSNALYSGLGSDAVVRGRLSYLEEPIWQFQRFLAAQLAPEPFATPTRKIA